jgi:hypothetical protein
VTPEPETWLLVIFRPELTVAWSSQDIGAGFALGDERFEAVEDDYVVSGFYDRLHSANGVLVGVVVEPALPELVNELAPLPYVRPVWAGTHLQILFEPVVAGTVLGENFDMGFVARAYRSRGNEVAISLDTDVLDESERQHLASRPLKWVTVTPISD